jgi:CHAT domain-containing protein/Tfp pilus assembly protein PilF
MALENSKKGRPMSHRICQCPILSSPFGRPSLLGILAFLAVGVLLCTAATTTGLELVFSTRNNAASGPKQESQNSRLLEPDKPLESKIKGNEKQRYQLSLTEGQYMRLVIDQRGVDLVLALSGIEDKLIQDVNNFGGSYGRESLAVIAKQSGTYWLEVTGSGKESGSYEIRIAEIRPSAPGNQLLMDARHAAQKAIGEGKAITPTDKKSFEAIIAKLKEAIRQWRIAEDRIAEANTIDLLAETYSSVSASKQAVDLYKQSLVLWRAEGSLAMEGSVLQNIGIAYYSAGERRQAQDFLNQALPIQKSVGDVIGQLVVLTTLGLVNQSLGENLKAIEYSNQAVQLLPKVPPADDSNAVGHVLNGAGVAYWSSGDNQKALALFNQALPAFVDVDDKLNSANVLTNISHAYSGMNNDKEALVYLKRALPLLDKTSLSARNVRAYTLTSLGAVYDRLGNYREAIKVQRQALSLWRATGDRNGEASALNNLGYAYYHSGQKLSGIKYYESALRLARTVPYPQGESMTLLNLGRAYEEKGNLRTALSYYRQSIVIREDLRTTARVDEFRSNFAARSFNVYSAAVLVNLRLKDSRAAFELSERARARTFLDQIGNTRLDIRKGVNAQLALQEQGLLQDISNLEEGIRLEKRKPESDISLTTLSALNSQLAAKRREYDEWYVAIKVNNSEYGSLGSVDPPNLQAIQKLMDRDTTLLSYFITEQKVIVFIITNESFNSVPLAVSPKNLTSTINWFRSFPNLGNQNSDSLKQLYSWLVAPLKEHIKTPTIGIVPHGILNYLPFAALTDGQHYFGDEFTLFYMPSVSVVNFIRTKTKPIGSKLLAIAQAKSGSAPVLQYADEEAKAVAHLYDTEAITGPSASKTAFLSLVRSKDGYTIFHFAAHAELNAASPLFSRILLAPDDSDNGSLDLREVYNLDLSGASLVVLSACETQLGPQSRGDDVIALNRAFIYAGTPTVIASLWTVDDEATSVLMKSFYGHLRQGMSKAEALRAAQRETRTRYPHPYYWASFVLTGDPGKSVPLKQ